MLCGYGANAINPYMAFEGIYKLRADGDLPEDEPVEYLIDHYISAVKKGILKTMSKMGISTLRSYHSAQQFEAVGLNREFVNKYFHGTASRIGGADLEVIAREALARHRRASAGGSRGCWISTTAASINSASTASGTCGTPPPSPPCSTRC